MTTDTTKIRVMTLNIGKGATLGQGSVQDNLDGFANLIDSENIDIVGLQEVDIGTTRSGGIDEVDYLKSELQGRQPTEKWSGLFAKAIDFQGGEYGIAILTRLNFRDPPKVQRWQLSPKSSEPRVAMAVKIDDLGGTGQNKRQLWFVTTHLGLKTSDDPDASPQLGQISYILQKMQTFDPAVPSILCGDFNIPTSDDSVTYDQLNCLMEGDDFRDLGPKGVNTFKNKSKIDYIYIREVDDKVIPGKAFVEKTYPTLSDHNAIICPLTFQFGKNG